MPKDRPPEGHVLIIGFGLGGKTVARVLKNLGLRYLVIETNSETVNQLKDQEPIMFGDASSTEILHSAGIEGARLVVAVTSSVSTLTPVMDSIRRLNKTVPVLARTNYLLDLNSFKPSPHTEFIVGELETSLELIHRTLEKCDVPKNKVDQFVSEMRVAMGTRVTGN
jgi:CPA2 family monovalent cation:H+ antiporter-2